MKKSVILAILGIGAATVASYGQGSIAFNTYTAAGNVGIYTTFGNGPSVGTGIGSTFTGELLWSTTNPNDAATTALTANTPLNPIWNVGGTAGSVGGNGTFATGAATPGYITGVNLDITAAVGQALFFEVVAFNGASYGAGTYAGHSASFAATLATGANAPGADQIDAMAPFSVFQTVPEPTTMALGGLGLAALLVARRKKA
jgi:hypothetical protein